MVAVCLLCFWRDTDPFLAVDFLHLFFRTPTLALNLPLVELSPTLKPIPWAWLVFFNRGKISRCVVLNMLKLRSCMYICRSHSVDRRA